MRVSCEAFIETKIGKRVEMIEEVS